MFDTILQDVATRYGISLGKAALPASSTSSAARAWAT